MNLEADADYDNKRYESAATKYEQYLLHNNDILYVLRLAQTYIMLRQYEKALERYEEAIRLNPQDSTGYNGKGYTLKWLRRYDEALECYHHALNLDPNNYEVYSNLGNTLRKLGRLQEALRAYERAIQINPQFPYAHNGKGNILFDLDKKDEALGCYEEALRLKPDFYNAYNGKGNVHRNRNEVDLAIKSYDKALEINPKYTYAWNGKGNALSQIEEYDKAIDCYQRALDIDPKYSNSYIGKGNCLKKFGQTFESLRCYSLAIEYDHTNLLGYCYRGALLLSIDPTQSYKDLIQSLNLLENPKILNHLSQSNATQTKQTIQRLLSILNSQNMLDEHLNKQRTDISTNPKLKRMANEAIFLKEKSRKKINDNLDTNNDNDPRMSYGSLVRELEQIENQYRQILSEIRNHSQEIEHQSKIIDKHEKEINWLIDIQESSGTIQRSELRRKIQELRDENINYHEYYRAFYWTLFNYFMTYKMISTGLVQNTQAGVEEQKEKFILQLTKLTLDIAGKALPVVGDLCDWVNKLLDQIYDQVKTYRFQQRVSIINKLIEQTTDTFEQLDVQISMAAIHITVGKKQEIVKAISIGEVEKNSLVERLKQKILGKKIDLYDSQASLLALKDVLAALGYIYIKNDIIFPQIKERSMSPLKTNIQFDEMSTPIRSAKTYQNLIEEINQHQLDNESSQQLSLSDLLEEIVLTRKGELLLPGPEVNQIDSHKNCCLMM